MVLINGVTNKIEIAYVRLCHPMDIIHECLLAQELGDGLRPARSGVRLSGRQLRELHARTENRGVKSVIALTILRAGVFGQVQT